MKTLDLLKQLIAIPSFLEKNIDESRVAKYITDYFLNLGYNFDKQIIGGKRANLIFGNSENPEIIILGHMDTVILKEQTRLPLQPRVIANKLYGLGAVDMKAGLAIMLSLALRISSDKIAYVFTCDEEYEFKGAIKLAEKYTWNPKMVINLEPTGLQISNGCRGITEFSFDVYGKSAHASRKYLGVNAIEKTIFITQALEKELQKQDNTMKTSLNVSSLEGGILQTMQKNNPSISTLGMVVPDFARVNCEIRIGNKTVTKKQIGIILNILAKKEKVGIKNISFKFFLDSFFTSQKNIKEFESAVQKTGVSTMYRDINTSGFYEVQILQEAWKCNAVIFGPGPIEMAHAANEYVDITSVGKTEKVVEEYLKSMLE